jgi:hypothetical protein
MTRFQLGRSAPSAQLSLLLMIGWSAITGLIAIVLITGTPGPGPEVAPAPGLP